MTIRSIGDHEVFLNGNLFPIIGQVRSITSIPAELRTVQRVTWVDQRGGMGTHRIGPNGPFNVCWDTSWDVRFGPGHLITGGIIAETNNMLSGSGVVLVGELDGELVATDASSIKSLPTYGGAWSTRDASVPAAPVDIKNGNLGGTEYLVVAFGSGGFAYADAIAAWADNTTTNAFNIEFWDDRIWTLADDGRLRYIRTINGTAVSTDGEARIFLSHGEVITGLFKARAKSDNNAFILYATTSKKLLAHDSGNNKFIEITDVEIGNNNELSHERPYAVFKGKIYLASGRAIIEYDPVNLTVDYIGFDQGDGLPAGVDGRITAMAASTTQLFVGTKAVLSGTDAAVVMAWDGRGWQRIYTDADSTEVVDSLHVARLPTTNVTSGVGGDVEYLWIGTTNRVITVLINNSQTRSLNIDGWQAAHSGADHAFKQHIFPIFSVPGFTTVALRLKVDLKGATSSNGVKVFVAFDQAAQTQMTNPEFTTDSTFDATNDRIEGDGVTTFTFPTGENDKSGKEFRDIQVALEISGANTGQKIDVYSVVLEYLPVDDDTQAWEFELDFTSEADAKPVEELRAAYVTARKAKTLVEATFRDDTGNTRNLFVKIMDAAGDEDTGYEEKGTVRVRVESP